MFDIQWIIEGLKNPGKSRTGIAKALNRSPSMVTDLLNGERALKASEIPKIANYLGVIPPPPLAGVVPIVGKVGKTANGVVKMAPRGQNYGEAPMAPGVDKDTVAIEVDGDSIRGITQEGSLLYYEANQLPPGPEMLGELCVVALSDDRILIKYLHPGRGEGLYDLESGVAAPTLRDVPVRWAALVTAIIPRAQAQKLIRREKAKAPAESRRSGKKRK